MDFLSDKELSSVGLGQNHSKQEVIISLSRGAQRAGAADLRKLGTRVPASARYLGPHLADDGTFAEPRIGAAGIGADDHTLA